MSLLLKNFQLITFDCTNTLLKFRQNPVDKYSEITQRFNVKADPRLITENYKKMWKKMTTEHPNYGVSTIGWENWWKKIVVGTLNKSIVKNENVNGDTLNNIAAELINVYKTTDCWELNTGTNELLEYLSKKKMRLGVISNYDVRLHEILYNLGIKKHFDFILTSYEARVEKPSKLIFDEALKLSKVPDIKPLQALHVGDNKKLDFDAAINANWKAVLISSEATNEGILQYENLLELKKTLEAWNN